MDVVEGDDVNNSGSGSGNNTADADGGPGSGSGDDERVSKRASTSALAAAANRRGGMPKLQLFDLVAGGAFERALEGMGRQEGGEEGVWSYLPLFLQMLRDGSTRSGQDVGDRFDKLLRVVVQNRRADSTEDYLNIAKDCCTHLRKGPAPPPPSTATSRMASRLPPDRSKGSRRVATLEARRARGRGRRPRGIVSVARYASRREGKQIDLLLEVESLEPKELMSVGTVDPPANTASSGLSTGNAAQSTASAGQSQGGGGNQSQGGRASPHNSSSAGGATGGRRDGGSGGGGSSESLDLLSQRSLEEELHMLLPVLLAHAPRIRMREVSAALLRTRFAPSLLHVSAMNDPLSLESIVLGVCDALTATPKGNVTRTSHKVSQRAEELVMRLCGLGAIATVKVRGVLTKRRSLPGVCARMACEFLRLVRTSGWEFGDAVAVLICFVSRLLVAPVAS
ncbi:unnamed protein product [Scytosiphon promiscuus]